MIKPEKSRDLSKEVGMFITRHDHRYKSNKKRFETDIMSVIHQGCGFSSQVIKKTDPHCQNNFNISCKQLGIFNVKNLFIFKYLLYYELIQ